LNAKKPFLKEGGNIKPAELIEYTINGNVLTNAVVEMLKSTQGEELLSRPN
jgi:hypothetical protein